MQFQFFRKIIKEDFPQSSQDLVSKLGFIINPCFTQLVSILNNNINWTDNFAAVTKTITVTVDSSGRPTTTTSFSVDLATPCKHLWVTRAQNQTNSTTYPTSAPFVSWTQSGSQITINNITGLQANQAYQLEIITTI